MSTSDRRTWVYILSVALVVVPCVAAVHWKLWVLTALPVGFLFGFFLQKGDLCGASAFSEVILASDGRKIFGLWVAIVTAMCGFAVLDLAGLVTLNPKPLIYWNYLVGGLAFGTGIVLAGGCVSGCLYKAATGNLNSIAALLAMPVGIASVEYGPLHSWFTGIKKIRLANADGSSVTFSSVSGLPFWLLAALFAVATILVVVIIQRRRQAEPARDVVPEGGRFSPLSRSWKPWQAGLAIGLLSAVAYLSSAESGRNYPLGTTHGVLQATQLVTEQNVTFVYEKKVASAQTLPSVPKVAQQARPKKVVWWLVLLVGALMVGSFSSARLSGQARLLPKPPDQILWAILGGFLVGAGAAIATGCVIGNILSGCALMSVGTVLFGIVVILANWLTTWLYLMGADRSGWSK